MDIGNRVFTVTVDGIRVPLTLCPCADCPGTNVYQGGDVSYGGHVGHVRVTANRLWALVMVSGGCPGDVSVSTAHGVVKKGKFRTQMFVKGLRSLVRASS
jgi:hypothetical protein